VKTPLRPGLDDEIYEVEARISSRRERIPEVARSTGRSALHAMASPAGLATAAVLGFVIGGGLRRNGHQRPTVERRKTQEKTKGALLGSLVMTGVTALIRAQFGSPANMAKVALEKFQKIQNRRRPAATGGM
jgi:hypothetical protein